MPLRVATYNLHGGVDGWGRTTAVVRTAIDLDADVLFLQESWRGEGVDLAAQIATGTGASAHTVALASGHRATGGEGGRGWQPLGAYVRGNRGLFIDSERPLGQGAAAALAAAAGAAPGEWCLSVVSRLEVLAFDVVELRHLARDRARRRLLVATLSHPRGPIIAFGLHGAHLTHGSLGQYRELAHDLDALRPCGEPAILGGDFNSWGPIVRRLLPAWHQAARGRTWPSWRPHSQLDHLFVAGPITVLRGGAVDARASDHRPVAATIEIGTDTPVS